MGWTTLFPQFIFGFVMTSAEIKNKHSQTWKSNISNDIVNGKKSSEWEVHVSVNLCCFSFFHVAADVCEGGKKL